MEIHNRLKNEVMKDYFTANVKAEVLIDTILTPVIDEILTFFVNGKDSDSKVKLLAKEFPLPVQNLSSCKDEDSGQSKKLSYRSRNVDYLMSDRKCIYFVELKTTWSSFEKDQMENYLKHCRIKNSFGEKEGFDFIRLLNHVSKTGKSELEGDMSEVGFEKLEELFRHIIDYVKKDGAATNHESGDFSSQAKKYLIDEEADSSKKYLFTVGQILDHKGDEKWWGYKNRKLIYIGPGFEGIKKKGKGYQIGKTGPFLSKKAGRVVTFQDIIKHKDDISSIIANPDLEKYWEWVVEILKEIPVRGERKKTDA